MPKPPKVWKEDEYIKIGIINLSDNPNSVLKIRLNTPGQPVQKITKNYLSVHSISKDDLKWKDFEIDVIDYHLGSMTRQSLRNTKRPKE